MRINTASSGKLLARSVVLGNESKMGAPIIGKKINMTNKVWENFFPNFTAIVILLLKTSSFISLILFTIKRAVAIAPIRNPGSNVWKFDSPLSR